MAAARTDEDLQILQRDGIVAGDVLAGLGGPVAGGRRGGVRGGAGAGPGVRSGAGRGAGTGRCIRRRCAGSPSWPGIPG